jgi:bromodomain adjacent to zinc finger domain protein 1A
MFVSGFSDLVTKRCVFSSSRDRLTFSKSILRRFIRDCVDRDAAVASPWIVKKTIAERYGVSTIMPEETRKGVETIKKGEIEKRKKVWEEKDGPATKKQKKIDDQGIFFLLIFSPSVFLIIIYSSLAGPDVNGIPKGHEDPPKPPVEKKKKKPLRYPAEDMDVVLTEKDKKAGARVQRPVPSRNTLPFGDHFEEFLMSWNFLVVYGCVLFYEPMLRMMVMIIFHSLVNPCICRLSLSMSLN